eukprot:gb/GECG01009416.1/.p1 GENE.gb/GECG01009416.1/~~gb/GECG01009416.1/.p1  ORF type:complete len:292 (+),score=46.34 gb/GECG01009416.1/:1-876(+)
MSKVETAALYAPDVPSEEIYTYNNDHPVFGLTGIAQLLLDKRASSRHSGTELYRQIKAMDKLVNTMVKEKRHLRLYLWALTDDRFPQLHGENDYIEKRLLEFSPEDVPAVRKKLKNLADNASKAKTQIIALRKLQSLQEEISIDSEGSDYAGALDRDDGFGLMSLCVCAAYLQEFDLHATEIPLDLRGSVRHLDDENAIEVSVGEIVDTASLDYTIQTFRQRFRILSIAAKLLMPKLQKLIGIGTIYFPQRPRKLAKFEGLEQEKIINVDIAGTKGESQLTEKITLFPKSL